VSTISVEEYRKLNNKPLKYRNIPTPRQVGNVTVTFSSKKEANRYDELLLMLNAGEIKKLKIQPQFTLQEAFTQPDGKKISAIRYTADFSYIQDGKLVIEDVKSTATKSTDYKIKKVLMAANGNDVVEV